MKNSTFFNNYLGAMEAWAGFEIHFLEDFEDICTCDLDFVELLLIGEHKFSLNLLDTESSRYDFKTVNDFINWAGENSILQVAS